MSQTDRRQALLDNTDRALSVYVCVRASVPVCVCFLPFILPQLLKAFLNPVLQSAKLPQAKLIQRINYLNFSVHILNKCANVLFEYLQVYHIKLSE